MSFFKKLFGCKCKKCCKCEDKANCNCCKEKEKCCEDKEEVKEEVAPQGEQNNAQM